MPRRQTIEVSAVNLLGKTKKHLNPCEHLVLNDQVKNLTWAEISINMQELSLWLH
jgi:hypothetical protein